MTPPDPPLVDVAVAREAGHVIGVSPLGVAYSRGLRRRGNELGQLGRQGDTLVALPVRLVADADADADTSGRVERGFAGGLSDSSPATDTSVRVERAFAGGLSDSGHSALLDERGHLWVTGCDRWQQLGLGSSGLGATGYTWKEGRLWQEEFQRNDFVAELLRKLDPALASPSSSRSPPTSKWKSTGWIRDVALGGDHTLVLSANRKDVVAFGKGGEGQLGLRNKTWVSAPAKSAKLSSNSADIAAVCAVRHCSMTLSDGGDVMKTAGKCRMSEEHIQKALKACQNRARKSGLLVRKVVSGDG